LEYLGSGASDGVADVFAQDEFRVFTELIDPVAKFQFFIRVGDECTAFPEQFDELPEKIAVVEFRGSEFTQLGNTLSGLNAQ